MASALLGPLALADGKGPTRPAVFSSASYRKPADAQLQKQLSPCFEVTQHAATEPPFRNAFWDHHDEGLYVDVVTGEPLFSSHDKFDSGTGWPSFTRPVEDGARGRTRWTAPTAWCAPRCARRAGDSHLGHLFDDGPPPTGAALLHQLGVAALHPGRPPGARATASTCRCSHGRRKAKRARTTLARSRSRCRGHGAERELETAVLAGGCFWGMEDILRKIPGVLEHRGRLHRRHAPRARATTTSSTGDTGHAESVRVAVRPAQALLRRPAREVVLPDARPDHAEPQGNDVGTQYRSAIFVTSPAQQQTAAEPSRTRSQRSGRWKRPVVTEIVDAGRFTPAEDYHQDYLEKHPGGYTCHYLRD